MQINEGFDYKGKSRLGCDLLCVNQNAADTNISHKAMNEIDSF